MVFWGTTVPHNKRIQCRLATSVRRLRHDWMEQGPTEPHTLHAARSY